GTLTAGFLFLPTFGLRRSLAIAVTLNIIAGLLALRVSRGEAIEEPSPKHQAEPSSRHSKARPPYFFLACFAAVGATAMFYEIGWTRLLSTQLGSSTYAFTLMLGTFLTGIVLGSIFFERWNRSHDTTSMTFALTQTFTAIAVLAFLIFFTHLIEILPPILRA